MTTIELVANDQLLQVIVNPNISSGEVNTIKVHVDFSDEWNGFGKNAVFYTSYNSRDIYEIVMTNNECIIPSEVMTKSGILYIGIRGVNSEKNKVKTTSLVKLKISEGTPTGNSTGVEPTPDVYQQLLSAYGKTDNSINKEISDRKSAISTEKAERQSDIANEKAERQAEIAVERARIDNLSTLTEGSTTADAELLDIRVKADASIATSAGNAVREQVSELKEDLVKHEEYFKTIAEPKDYINILDGMTLVDGYIQTDGTIGATTTDNVTDYIKFAKSDTIHFYGGKPNELIRWATYNENKSFANSDFFNLDVNGEYNFKYDTPYVDHNYLRFSYSKVNDNLGVNYGTEKVPKTYKVKKDALPEIVSTYDYIVAKDGTGNFTSVSEACNVAKDGESIYIKSGVYDNEVITGTYTKKLYLIGESAQDVIIKNNTGQYLHEPIQIGSGLLKNLTFYAELEDGQERSEGQIEYAVHVESHNLANDNLTIENCILKSDYNVALGMGMRGGCNVIIKNCHLIGTHNGALTIHDSNYDDYLGVQNVSLINNIIEVTNNTTCINFQSQEKEASIVNIECIGNRVYSHQNGTLVGFGNYYGGTGSEDDWQGLKNWRLKGTSWGNSTDILN